MRHPLQNHPGIGRRDLPVRARWWNLQLDRNHRGQLPTAVLMTGTLGALALVMVLFTDVGPIAQLTEAGGDVGEALATATQGQIGFWIIGLLFGAGCLALAVNLGLVALRRPLREQRRYYEMRGLEAPEERLRRALRTSAGWAHLKSIWPLSIEVLPTSEGMTPRQVRSFRTLPLMSAEENRDGLASDWGILHAQQARATIAEYMSVGVHSSGFAMALHHGDADTLDSMAALADIPTTRLLEIGTACEGRPPQLLWGWDLVRTTIIVRQSESAGYLDRETAIDLLEEITDLIVALFPTEAELLENCRLGFALWAGPERRAEVRERRRLDAEYLAGEWPSVLGPWPEPSGRALPPAMAEGFARDLHPDPEDAEDDPRF